MTKTFHCEGEMFFHALIEKLTSANFYLIIFFVFSEFFLIVLFAILPLWLSSCRNLFFKSFPFILLLSISQKINPYARHRLSHTPLWLHKPRFRNCNIFFHRRLSTSCHLFSNSLKGRYVRKTEPGSSKYRCLLSYPIATT